MSSPVNPDRLGVEEGVSYVEKAAVEAFFRTIPLERARDRLLFDLTYRHGLRRGEATLLRLSSIRPDRIWIGRLKGSISGEYPLHPSSRKLLAAYLPVRESPESPFLFTGRQSREEPLSVSRIFQLFRAYAEAAGLPEDRRHPHVLRHSIAVHLMNAGWDLADVQDWLGHKDIASTTVYTRITNGRRSQRYLESLESGEIAETLIS